MRIDIAFTSNGQPKNIVARIRDAEEAEGDAFVALALDDSDDKEVAYRVCDDEAGLREDGAAAGVGEWQQTTLGALEKQKPQAIVKAASEAPKPKKKAKA